MTDALLHEQIILGIKNETPQEVIYCYLHEATDKVKLILGVDGPSGESLLHLCLTYRCLDLFTYMVDELTIGGMREIDSVRHISEDTLLHRLCDFGEYGMVADLLARFNWDTKKTNNYGISVSDLITAASE